MKCGWNYGEVRMRWREKEIKVLRKKGWINEAEMVFVLLLMRKSGWSDEQMSLWGWNDEEIFKGRNEDRIDGDLRLVATSLPGLGTPTLLCTSLPPPPAFQYFNSDLYLYLYLPCSFVSPPAFPYFFFFCSYVPICNLILYSSTGISIFIYLWSQIIL